MYILVEEFYSKKEGFYNYPLFFFHANLGSGGEEVAAGRWGIGRGHVDRREGSRKRTQ